MSGGANQVSESPDPARDRVPRWLVVLAGLPLLMAMLIEFGAVLARNVGWNLVGSIELVQAMILLSSSGAMVAATLSRAHAKVSIFSSRYRGRSGRAMQILLAVGGSAFFTAVAIGSTWIAWDMRGGAEQSELLGIPYLPLRVLVTVAMFIIALIYVRRIFVEPAAR
jgi:TRAP-type C4-dicarboxylate transport system permease small subunit